jgi:hypothetical protein
MLASKASSTAKPRKKFKFTSLQKSTSKSRSVTTRNTANDVTHKQDVTESVKAVAGSLIIEGAMNDCKVFSKLNLREISPEERSQILVRKCTGLKLISFSLIGSIRIEDLVDSYVVLGSCGTSVYLEGCKNVILFVTCHQLRIHKCTDCQIYVHCKSHPIIEDCMGMGFAPYHLTYDSQDSDVAVK